MIDYSALTATPLFKGIAPNEIQTILGDEAPHLLQTFAKGDVLAEQDSPCNRLIILMRGKIRAEMTDVSGRVVKIEDVSAPSPLAILFLFGTNNKFPVRAIADEETIAIVIPKQLILKMLQNNENLLRNYLDISADFATRLSQKLYFMSFRSIRQKISMYLLELAHKQQTDTVQLDRTKSSLAEYFGVSRPSLERELTNMQTAGFIGIHKKEITLLQKAKMVGLVKFGG